MILDAYKPYNLIFQITYENAYELWDHAGAIGRKLCQIWPGITVQDGKPHLQTFTGDGIVIQTSINNATVTFSGSNALSERNLLGLQETYGVWCEMLDLSVLTRASTRVTYGKSFDSIKEANAVLFGLQLTSWPQSKVFDQPVDGEMNGLDITYRFEDKNSFSVLRVKAEQVKTEVKLDPEMFDEPKKSKTINRMVIDFDRGLLGSVDSGKFRVDEWMKGFLHLLRRDIEKVLRSNQQ